MGGSGMWAAMCGRSARVPDSRSCAEAWARLMRKCGTPAGQLTHMACMRRCAEDSPHKAHFSSVHMETGARTTRCDTHLWCGCGIWGSTLHMM